MTEPRYEFWRDITPVLRFEIPDQAEFYDPMHEKWCPRRDISFDETQLELRWRVPVEVIPLEVAVEAIACNAEYHNNSESWVVEADGTRCYGGNLVALHDSIAEALRKAAK